MFSQTFVDGAQRTKKPVTVLASTLLQIVILGIAVLIPLLYTESLPSAQLKSILTAPAPPAAPVRPVVKTASTSAVRRVLPLSLLVAPRVVPRQIAAADNVPAAPDLGGLNAATDGSGTDGSALLLATPGTAALPPPPAVAPEKKAPRTLRVGGVVAEANVIHRVQPVYPALARSARVSGTVEFTAVISKEGRVEQLQLLHGHPLLVNAAREAILQWRYRPTLLNGQPVEVVTTIVVNFTLSGG